MKNKAITTTLTLLYFAVKAQGIGGNVYISANALEKSKDINIGVCGQKYIDDRYSIKASYSVKSSAYMDAISDYVHYRGDVMSNLYDRSAIYRIEVYRMDYISDHIYQEIGGGIMSYNNFSSNTLTGGFSIGYNKGIFDSGVSVNMSFVEGMMFSLYAGVKIFN